MENFAIMNVQQTRDPNKRFLIVQVNKIKLDKWYEGIRIKRDPGKAYVYQWINEKAESFREAWNHSRCRHCYHWHVCGHEIKTHCAQFDHDFQCEQL
ncbi:hypothetical protein JW935_23135 [candidate division KSB1 bacterium]|nr:hypothetical protein [candidate division KSB1 bacterium]